MVPNKLTYRFKMRYLVVALVFLLALYVVLPQIGQFKSSLHLLRHPEPGWTVLAVVFAFATYLAGAGTYCLLAFKRLRYGRTLLVQFAAMFVNRLLPAGIGALGANYVYLKKQKHSTAQAASVVAVNNILGSLGHNILLGGVLIFGGQTILSDWSAHPSGSNLKYITIGLVAILVLVLILGWNRFKDGVRQVKNQLFDYRRRPLNLLGALGTSMCLTAANVLALYACANALGVHLGLGLMMLIFTFGISAGTATPTPGGLGGFEAGLVAGFVAFDVASSTALAIALLYRLITYWLTLAAGAVAFVSAERSRLI